MAEQRDFRTLLDLARAGDPDAAAELFRRYEPAIQRVIRLRMRDSRLRRQFDSADVCQSVMASFFARAALGQFDLNSPEELLRLLTTMARNKLANAVHREQAQCRDYRRMEIGDGEERQLPGRETTPSHQVALSELIERFYARLTEEERILVQMRSGGREWADIAQELGCTPEALRKRHDRAIDRIAQELGLDEIGPE